MRFLLCILVASLAFTLQGVAETKQSDPVMQSMTQELKRSFDILEKQPLAPYFISYQLTDTHTATVKSSFGALTNSTDKQSRGLDMDLRVGDYTLDSSHGGGGMLDFGRLFGRESRSDLPIEDGADALKLALWRETNRHYSDAIQRLEAIKANREVKSAEEDNSPDFSPAPAERYSEPTAPMKFDRAVWEKKVRLYGRPFRILPDVDEAEISASSEAVTKRYVNTDGAEVQTSSTLYKLSISASIKAADGTSLPLKRIFMSFSPEGLPSDEAVLRTVDEMKALLLALQKAPVADAYTGPAVLSGRASAVFFHEIFGHRIEGARLKSDDDAQTFKKKINQQVLPPFLSIYSDPTVRRREGFDLVGYYPYDDEGVKARRVAVVENGIFKSFLMSRSPIEGFLESNGHGRHHEGVAIAARQSNLFVEASKTVSREELKKMLLETIKAENKPYGLFLDDIEGGFTLTSRSMPNSFKVLPTVAYRVYPDGREELVRGLDLIGTPLIAFSKIIAADNEVGVFDGVCGAESGWIPVSAVAPGLLLEQIEVQRKKSSHESNPVLPDPAAVAK